MGFLSGMRRAPPPMWATNARLGLKSVWNRISGYGRKLLEEGFGVPAAFRLDVDQASTLRVSADLKGLDLLGQLHALAVGVHVGKIPVSGKCSLHLMAS